MSVYGDKVADLTDVAYEPVEIRDEDGNAVVVPPYYYLRSDPSQRVVWVQPESETGIDTRGFFALFTGDGKDYEAVVPEAA